MATGICQFENCNNLCRVSQRTGLPIKHCCPSHYQKDWYLKNRKGVKMPPRIERDCVKCGKIVLPPNTKYCSKKCARIYKAGVAKIRRTKKMSNIIKEDYKKGFSLYDAKKQKKGDQWTKGDEVEFENWKNAQLEVTLEIEKKWIRRIKV